MLPPAERGCCCWRLNGYDDEYSELVPTLLKPPQTAPSLVLETVICIVLVFCHIVICKSAKLKYKKRHN